jgi:hypothetical protein
MHGASCCLLLAGLVAGCWLLGLVLVLVLGWTQYQH